jgi:hypothetical protein
MSEREEQVLKVALELQEADERARAESKDRDDRMVAAAEVGLDRQWIEKAEGVIAAREREAAAARKRVPLAVVGASGLLAAGTALMLFMSPRPEPAWRVAFDPAPAYVLDKNAETAASAAFQAGVGVLTVERFAPDAAGAWRANLDISTLPADLSPYDAVAFQLQGDLPIVRVYLDNGSERWRSPAIPVPADRTPKTVDFSSFEHQRKGADGWKVVDWTHPDHAAAVSFKVGTYMNDVDATGTVRVDELEFE